MHSSGFVVLVQSPIDSNPKSSVPYLGIELNGKIHQDTFPCLENTNV